MAHGPEFTAAAGGVFRPGSQRGVNGFFRVAQQFTGHWWLLDPQSRPVFLKAVHGVAATIEGSEVPAAKDPAARLRAWGFDAVGLGGDGAGREDGLAYLAGVEFCSCATNIIAPGIRLPDVFDPDWPRRATDCALAVCTPLASTRELVGWVTDGELGWGAAEANRSGLLQVCLSLEPGYAAYHAAWEFVLASHGGRLDLVARAWSVPLANKEVVREMTRTEIGILTRGYLKDEAQWSREFARRYFAATTSAIRAADPNHLVFGCRFPAPVGPAVLGAVTYPAVDVALLHWSELPASGGATSPVLASEIGWSDESFWGLPTPGPDQPPGTSRAGPRLTSVERMLRRGRTALKRLARHPAVVGYVWRQWHDDPGEQPPFAHGLVHRNGAEAREHTELLTEFNVRADALRRAATKSLSP